MVLPVLNSIDFWSAQLSRYPFHSLCIKPSSVAWSLGQLYVHLIDETAFYFMQAERCLASSNNAAKDCKPEAQTMFLNDSFPNENINGSPNHSQIAQPQSVASIAAALLHLKERALAIDKIITGNSFSGKTKHPGLGYFNAVQWMQFADMHFRHHLRQKKKLDLFLGTT